jgi:hypothetical protein
MKQYASERPVFQRLLAQRGIGKTSAPNRPHFHL